METRDNPLDSSSTSRAHAEHNALVEGYKLKDRFPHIWHFPSRRRFFARMDSYLQDVAGKTILDYGCGRAEKSLKYLEREAVVWGIDISPAHIADANRIAQNAGYPECQFSFHVMDAHDLAFDDDTIDIVVGYGILHHLDAEIALSEIHRVLKPGGRVLLQEPMADNPLLKLFRLLTPHARVKDERPLSRADIENLSCQRQWKTDMVYCGLVEAPVAMITSILMPRYPDNVFLRLADKIERWTHEKGILLSWNQYVLFNMVKLPGTERRMQ